MKIAKTSYSSKDIELLWDSLRQGDRKGLEGLYWHFTEDLFRFGCSKGYNIDFVQDCVQEVFIDLWNYHKRLQKADNVKVYLFKSLLNKMNKESKIEKRNLTAEKESVLEGNFFVESIETELIKEFNDNNFKKRIADSIELLPDRQKEVILFIFFEKLSYEEVAKLMGINLSSVYTLAWKAINRLKKVVLQLGLFLILLKGFLI